MLLLLPPTRDCLSVAVSCAANATTGYHSLLLTQLNLKTPKMILCVNYGWESFGFVCVCAFTRACMRVGLLLVIGLVYLYALFCLVMKFLFFLTSDLLASMESASDKFFLEVVVYRSLMTIAIMMSVLQMSDT